MSKEEEKKPTKKRKTVNFLNNSDLLEETIKSQEQGRMTEKLGKMLMILCDRYRANRVRRANFSNYTYFSDMMGFALVNLVKTGWKSFDATKYTNAYAFYTSCVHNSYLQYLNTEKRHRNIRDSLLVENGYNPSFKYLEEHADDVYENDDLHIKTSDDIIDDNRVLEYSDDNSENITHKQ